VECHERAEAIASVAPRGPSARIPHTSLVDGRAPRAVAAGPCMGPRCRRWRRCSQGVMNRTRRTRSRSHYNSRPLTQSAEARRTPPCCHGCVERQGSAGRNSGFIRGQTRRNARRMLGITEECSGSRRSARDHGGMQEKRSHAHACFSGGHAARPECSTREPRGDVIADGSEVIRGHQR